MAGASINIKVPATFSGKASEKDFKIGFVSNWVMREARQIETDMRKIVAEYQALQSGAKTVDEVDSELFNSAEGLLDRRYALVREILESNGLAFDLDFWDRNCGPDAVNAFIYQATHKDAEEVKKKL